MGKRADNNFKKRFGDPVKFMVIYPEKPLEGAEREYQSKMICDAYEQVLTGLLGRKPTRDEVLGYVPLSEDMLKESEPAKASVDYQI